MLNADLATGYAAVIVVPCFALVLPAGVKDADQDALNASLDAEIAHLREQGARVHVITPSAEFLALTQHGAQMLDVNLAAEAFQIGARQAVQKAMHVDVWWRQV